MTCAQGLLRLLWGGAEVGVLRDCQPQFDAKTMVLNKTPLRKYRIIAFSEVLKVVEETYFLR